MPGRTTPVDRPVRYVGYTGHWRNLGADNRAIFEHIQAWGASRNIEFKTIDYFKFNNMLKGTDDTYKQVPCPELICENLGFRV